MLAEYFQIGGLYASRVYFVRSGRSGGFMLAEYFARSGGFMLAESRVLCQIGGLYAG